MSKVNRYLLPLSALYGAGVALRGWLFDMGMLHSRSFNSPVICIGNITVGGTGKTPHTEMLVRLLQEAGHKVAILSRGYGRKTHGYVLAGDNATAASIGDEPMQMHKKFGDVTVAVCENRPLGVERILHDSDKRPVILLDDAFQHRYVKAGLNIVLMDYERPVYEDALLPAGRLREPLSALERAHVVIVTKCPASMTPIEFRVVQQKLGLHPWQKLFFTHMVYGMPYALFGNKTLALHELKTHEHVMLLSGIARPERLRRDMAAYCSRITALAFPDHHGFTSRDAASINNTFRGIAADDKIIITTEKDAARLVVLKGLDSDVQQALYVLPMHVEFLRDDYNDFCSVVLQAVKDMYD